MDPKSRTEGQYADQADNNAVGVFLAQEFCKGNNCSKKINVAKSRVLKVHLRSREVVMYNLENKISGDFKKWTNNSVFINPEISFDLLKFAKWSYTASSKFLMFTDIQGVEKDNEFFLTDPAIVCSNLSRFGTTNYEGALNICLGRVDEAIKIIETNPSLFEKKSFEEESDSTESYEEYGNNSDNNDSSDGENSYQTYGYDEENSYEYGNGSDNNESSEENSYQNYYDDTHGEYGYQHYEYGNNSDNNDSSDGENGYQTYGYDNEENSYEYGNGSDNSDSSEEGRYIHHYEPPPYDDTQPPQYSNYGPPQYSNYGPPQYYTPVNSIANPPQGCVGYNNPHYAYYCPPQKKSCVIS